MTQIHQIAFVATEKVLACQLLLHSVQTYIIILFVVRHNDPGRMIQNIEIQNIPAVQIIHVHAVFQNDPLSLLPINLVYGFRNAGRKALKGNGLRKKRPRMYLVAIQGILHHGCEKNQAQRLIFLPDLFCGVQTGQLSHADIQDQKVRLFQLPAAQKLLRGAAAADALVSLRKGRHSPKICFYLLQHSLFIVTQYNIQHNFPLQKDFLLYDLPLTVQSFPLTAMVLNRQKKSDIIQPTYRADIKTQERDHTMKKSSPTASAERSGAVRFFAIALAVLLLSSIFIWGFQTSWGDVRIERLHLNSPDGTKLSTLIYIPKNATVDNPAPCAVIYHGRSNQGHSNDTWSMELARRGYVVLSPDLTGGGESYTFDGGYFTDGRTMQGVATLDYALSLDIIDPEQVNLIGYSLGTNTATQVAAAEPEKVHSVLNVMGPFMILRSMDTIHKLLTEDNISFGILKADCDQYDYSFIGTPEECRAKVSAALQMDTVLTPDTDIPFGETSILRYIEVPGTMHQTGNISADTINAILSFEDSQNTAPISLANSDQQWLPQQLFSGIACVTMMFALAAFLNLLMQTSFFGSIAFARVPRKELRGAKAWLTDILFTFVIPAALFIPVSTWGMKWFAKSKILTSTNLNGIMLWLLIAMGLIGIIRMIVKANKRKKNGETIALSDYCIAAAGDNRFHWSYVGKAFLMGLIVVCFFGLWMTAMEGFLGIDYQVWNLSTYLKPSPERIVKSIPYMIIILIVMGLGNINQRVLPSTGNERKDLWIAVAVNTVLTASALFVLLVVQYGGSLMLGTGQVPFAGDGGSTGALDFAFGYCYMMGGTTGVVTYLYRKHGNVLAGVIPCAMFAGLFTLVGFTLVR